MVVCLQSQGQNEYNISFFNRIFICWTHQFIYVCVLDIYSDLNDRKEWAIFNLLTNVFYFVMVAIYIFADMVSIVVELNSTNICLKNLTRDKW